MYTLSYPFTEPSDKESASGSAFSLPHPIYRTIVKHEDGTIENRDARPEEMARFNAKKRSARTSSIEERLTKVEAATNEMLVESITDGFNKAKSKTGFDTERLTGILNELNNSPEARNRRLKFEYLKQEGANPPRFVLGIKDLKHTNENLRRYTENFLRSACNFEGVPVKVKIEKKVKK